MRTTQHEKQIKTVVHRAESRGRAEHGWLHSWHSFSFADYYNPQRMGFGKLRVLNDDVIEAGAGFGTHPHANMEIVSIPLKGGLRHRDSMGNTHVISHGEVQIMSAGTGITHSEYNASDSETVNLLQIWVMPKILGINPRYGQKVFAKMQRHNRWQTIVSPDGMENSLEINQEAWFSLLDLDANKEIDYNLHNSANGVYLFVLEGEVKSSGEYLGKRDALGVSDVPSISLQTENKNARLLCIEVPVR